MQIIWYGESCFKIITSEISILTDPFSPAHQGLKNPRLTSEVVIFSHPSSEKKEESNNFFSIDTPGEYEIKNIFIFSFPHFENNLTKIIHKIEAEEIKICFLGEIFSPLTKEELEKIGEIDLLLISFSPNFSFKEIVKIIEELQPKIIIPHTLKIKKEGIDLNLLHKFIKETNNQKIEKESKLRIKKKDFLSGKRKIIVLEPIAH